MLKGYFDELESGLLSAIEKGQSSPRKLYTLELARLGKRLYSGGGSIAWCGLAAPFDLLAAMGVTSCFVEFIGAMLASTGVVGSFIEETDTIGYSSDACSYHRSVSGAVLKGAMPLPEFLVGTTLPCSGGLAVLENLAHSFGKRIFVLHVPQDESGSNVRYLAEQIKAMAGFVSEVTGRSLDPAALHEAIGNMNRTSEIMKEVYRLAGSVPSPISSRELSNFGIVMPLFFGRPEAIAVAQSFRDELAKRVEQGKSGIRNERLRLLWIQNRIQFKHGLERILEEEYGAVIVIDELNDVTWDAVDPDDPYEGLARRCISIPFNGTADTRIAHLQKLAREYRIDGAINPCNWGCRQGTGGRGLIEEGLKRIGVPVLNLEVDCVDERKFAEGQFRTRLEAFMEMLAAKSSPRH